MSEACPTCGQKLPEPPQDEDRGPGRPTKLTPEIHAAILAQLQLTSFLDKAAAVVGVHKDTVYDWMRRGKAGEQPFADFSDAVSKALISAEVIAEGRIRYGMQKFWKAAAWYLERRNPKQWGPKVVVTLEREFDRAINRLRKALPPEWFAVALDAIIGDVGAEGSGGTPPGNGPTDSPAPAADGLDGPAEPEVPET